MKVLILSRYDRLGASSRLRLFQYLPFFRKNGIECEVSAFMDDRYLTDIYTAKGISKRNVLSGYWKRLKVLLSARKYDLIIVEKEIFPFLPAFAEWWLYFIKLPYIVDYDDAVFHYYDMHPAWLVRTLLGGKIRRVMQRAAVVVCGNSYLETYARAAGARNVTVVPTVIDPDRYKVGTRSGAAEVKIGWVGSPSTLKYVRMIKPVMEELCVEHRIKLCIMGGKSGIGIGESEEVVEWTEEGEAAYIASLDIGIMPLYDSPWERGKCGYKLIQYMACGLPVAGSPVGVNEEIILEGVNGFKPRKLEEWKQALQRLITDEGLRRTMGNEGRKMTLEKYSLRQTENAWLTLLKSVNRG